MTLTIDIPEKVIEQAAELGIPVDAFVAQTLEQEVAGPQPSAPPSNAAELALIREEATRTIRAIASRTTLGGLSIKDLINEDRRL